MTAPVKLTTLKNYIKDKTELRLQTAAAQLLLEHLEVQLDQTVERAAVLVEMQERSTLQERDMQQAISETWSVGGDSPQEVAEVVNTYEVSELSELVELVRHSLDE